MCGYYLDHIRTYINGLIQAGECMAKHYCFIYGNKTCVAAKGSDPNRTYYHGNFTLTTHAEAAAVNSLGLQSERKYMRGRMSRYSNEVKRYKESYDLQVKAICKKYQKLKVYVIRVDSVNKYEPEDLLNVKFLDSRPCLHCASILQTLGFKKIFYSTDRGGFTRCKLGHGQLFRVSSGSYALKILNQDDLDQTTAINWKFKVKSLQERGKSL